MMNRKMKQLALAVGVALGSMALVPSAQAVNVAANNQGQVLIFPYYTVNSGWSTLFGITNTSGSVVAAKVRFHEAYNSRDVFDFVIILSPQDVWTGWVTQNASGTPSIFTEDRSCTVGAISSTGQPFPGPVSYTGAAADGGPTTANRANQGYVEVTMMGAVRLPPAATPDPFALARGSVHAANGTPPGCAALVAAFQSPASLITLQGQFGYDSYAGTQAAVNAGPGAGVINALNPLAGSFSLVNGITGLNSSGRPVTLANFWAPPVPGGTGTGTGAAWNNLITAQLPPASIPAATVGLIGTPYQNSWHEPSLNSANTNGYVVAPESPLSVASVPASGILIGTDDVAANQNQTGNLVNGAGTGTGANAVSFVLNATNVINEWTRRTDPAAGWTTATDWVVTFPTKTFYTDNDYGNEFAGRSSGRVLVPAAANSLLPVLATNTVPAPFAEYFTNRGAPVDAVNLAASPAPAVLRGSSCVTTANTLYNREEASVVGQGFSPGGTNTLCYESNVLTFAGSNLLGAASPISQSLDSLPGIFGWLNLGLTASVVAGQTTTTGLPAIGFQITTRTNSVTGNTSLNSASIVDHSYLP